MYKKLSIFFSIIGLTTLGFLLMGDDKNDTTTVTTDFPDKDTISHSDKSGILAANFVPSALQMNDKLYVFWQKKGSREIIYSSWPNNGDWSEAAVLNDITSDFGVETVFLENLDTFCLFNKKGERSSGSTQYTCINPAPADGFSLPQLSNFDFIGNHEGLISVTPSALAENAFFAAISDNQNELNYLDCNLDNGTTPECLTISKHNVGKEPAIVEVGDYHYLIFSGENNKIHYFSPDNVNSTAILPMIDANENTRETDKPVDAYYFKDYVYVVWKNANNIGTRFSKIYHQNLLQASESNVPAAWEYCELNNEDGNPLVRTTETPSLFTYADRLYILYADESANNVNRISYYRIDNLDDKECKNKESGHRPPY